MHHRDQSARKNAKLALNDVWGKAIFILLLLFTLPLLLFVLETILATVLNIPGYSDILATPGLYLDNTPTVTPAALLLPLGLSLLSFLLLPPLQFGAKNWFYLRTYDAAPELGRIFVFFSTPHLYLRTICLHLRLILSKTFYAVVFTAPGIGLLLLIRHQFAPYGMTSRDQVHIIMGYLIASALLLLGLLLFCIFKQRYFLAEYALCDNPSLSPHQAVALSLRGMRGHKTQHTLFCCSFLGWGVLCLAVLPLLYVVPYYSTAQAIYARYYLELGANSLEQYEHLQSQPA